MGHFLFLCAYAEFEICQLAKIKFVIQINSVVEDIACVLKNSFSLFR